MSGVGLVAVGVAFCGGYTVRFGPKDPFAYMFISLRSNDTLEATSYLALCASSRIVHCDYVID